MKDATSQFSRTTVLLHWIVAITIITMMVVGTYMSENEVYYLFPIHKSIGMIVLGFIIMRVIWRLRNGFPTPVGHHNSIEIILAKLVHWVLLIGSILFPLSGMMMSGAGGHGLSIFGIDLLAANYDAAGQAVALNAQAAELGHNIHHLMKKVFIVAITLHVLGAIKHHVIDKDGTLRRMLGKRV